MSGAELVDAGFAFGGGPPVLDRLSLHAPPGSMTAVIGASGSGKSTALHLLGLLLTPTTGAVVVDGVDWTRRSDADRSRCRAGSIGFVFQDAALDTARSVLDNIVEGAVYAGVPRRFLRRRVEELVDRAGIDVPLDRRANGLSGGQAQRVGLCRALLRRPTLVVADEPTGNLDADNRDVVVAMLAEAAHGGAAVVLATHDAQVAGRCGQVVALPS